MMFQNKTSCAIFLSRFEKNVDKMTVKALLRPETYDICHPIIVGDSRIVERGVRAVGAKGLTVHPVQKVSDALFQPGTLDVYEVPLACENVDEIPYGKVTVIGGEAAFTCVRKVIELAMANKIDGTITGPLNKEAMNLAGYHYIPKFTPNSPTPRITP